MLCQSSLVLAPKLGVAHSARQFTQGEGQFLAGTSDRDWARTHEMCEVFCNISYQWWRPFKTEKRALMITASVMDRFRITEVDCSAPLVFQQLLKETPSASCRFILLIVGMHFNDVHLNLGRQTGSTMDDGRKAALRTHICAVCFIILRHCGIFARLSLLDAGCPHCDEKFWLLRYML